MNASNGYESAKWWSVETRDPRSAPVLTVIVCPDEQDAIAGQIKTGRELGREGLEGYLDVTSIAVAIGV